METVSRGTLDPWYVTGLVEGQGTFTFSRTGSHTVTAYFAVKTAGPDRTLLEDLQVYFDGAGAIYQVASRADAGRASNYYRVSRAADLERVVDHFDRFPLRGAKAFSYSIWRELATLKRTRRRADPAAIRELCDRLSLAAGRGRAVDTTDRLG